MLNSNSHASAIGAMLICAGATALAQTNPNSAASAPSTSVGVSPQVAASASHKAVPRSDTATLVRTGPTAPDRAREMGSAASGAASSAMTPSRSNRPAKADRK